MQMTKFEEKVKEFIDNHYMYIVPPKTDDYNDDYNKETTFRVVIRSEYKDKHLQFYFYGLNCFMFDVRDTTLDGLFDKAYRILKSYAPKDKKGE